jgi:outer membrane protein OmpA-like peptidoglycan-associated protein
MNQRGVSRVHRSNNLAWFYKSGVVVQPAIQTVIAAGVVLFGGSLLQPVQAAPQAVKVTVTSAEDTIQADSGLTLREAISVVNGTLPTAQLSAAEQALVSPSDRPQIGFNLPAGSTTIRLSSPLPDLVAPGLTIDGTTQTGYSDRPIINEAPLAVPLVAIAPAEGKTILRGLTVASDNVTIRGLSIYGFTGDPLDTLHQNTQPTPPANIFIVHRLPPPDLTKQPTPANFSPYYADDFPAKDTVIENNWIGIPPSSDGMARTTGPRSAFGVSVFNGVNTVIRRNWIADHEGSAIITSVKAENLQVSENAIIGNGVAGMPDGIRLEGDVNDSKITGNVICANDGSGIYLFKPSGSVQIRDNQISYNGRRLRRSAVYLMGSRHQVINNQVSYQAGPGVVSASYPDSEKNTIQGNRFVGLEGLSIDLVTQDHVGVFDYQKGDGPNPPRDSHFRRLETGNAAVNAPQFASREFVAVGTSPVQVIGKADPGSTVEVYRVSSDRDGYGSLLQPLGTTEVNSNGEFQLALNEAKSGDQLSAIATHPLHGTSEQAANVRVVPLDGGTSAETPAPQPASSVPQCVTAAAPPAPPEPPPEVIILKVPKNVHFALDQSYISAKTSTVLDRVAQVLRENPSILVEIQGHTDPRASDEYNLALGGRRAISVRNYLLRRGIANERMTIRSFGKRQLLTPGVSKLDHARNRRVEFDYRDARDIEVVIQEEDLQLEP